MLKNLKKKEGKADPKKDTKKEVIIVSNSEVAQGWDKEAEIIGRGRDNWGPCRTRLVILLLFSDKKDTTNVKNTKKVQSYKLEEKEIDTTNIVIEKKEEKKPINTWVVDEKDIKNIFTKDFDAKKH